MRWKNGFVTIWTHGSGNLRQFATSYFGYQMEDKAFNIKLIPELDYRTICSQMDWEN